MDSSESDVPAPRQARWRWRAEWGPGVFGFWLNDEPFKLYCTPTIESLGETRELLTLQIVLRRDGGQHSMDALSRETVRRDYVLIGLEQALLSMQKEKAEGDLDDGLFRERRSTGEAHQPL